MSGDAIVGALARSDRADKAADQAQLVALFERFALLGGEEPTRDDLNLLADFRSRFGWSQERIRDLVDQAIEAIQARNAHRASAARERESLQAMQSEREIVDQLRDVDRRILETVRPLHAQKAALLERLQLRRATEEYMKSEEGAAISRENQVKDLAVVPQYASRRRAPEGYFRAQLPDSPVAGGFAFGENPRVENRG